MNAKSFISIFGRTLYVAIAALVWLFACPFHAFSAITEADLASASEANPAVLTCPEDLLVLQDYADVESEVYVKLGADIDWATYSGSETLHPMGMGFNLIALYFDGAGHTISNLKMSYEGSGDNDFGLFATVSGWVEVKDLTISKADCEVYSPSLYDAGVFAGYIRGECHISNCSVDGKLSVGGSYGTIEQIGTGAFIGVLELTDGSVVEGISSSVAITADITGDAEFGANIGGVLGMLLFTDASACSVSKLVNRSEIDYYSSAPNVGGVIGKIYSSQTKVNQEKKTISDLYNYADVICDNADNIGGVVGDIDFYYFSEKRYEIVLSKCFNAGKVEGYSCVGGVAAKATNAGLINCVNLGTVTAYGSYAGGICANFVRFFPVPGLNTLEFCFNCGAVTASNKSAAIVSRFELEAPLNTTAPVSYKFPNNFNFASQPISTNYSFAEVSDRGVETSYVSPYYSDSTFLTVAERESRTFDTRDTSVRVLSTATLTSGDLDYHVEGLDVAPKIYRYSDAVAKGWTCPIIFEDGLYPMVDSDADIARLAAVPFYLVEGESVDSVATDFTLSTAYSVTWQSISKGGKLTIDGNSASIDRAGKVQLIATLGEATKVYDLTLLKNVFGGGHGTIDDPYILRNASHIKELADSVAATSGSSWGAGKYFTVAADIADVTAIVAPTSAKAFAGTINGNGHTIYLNVSAATDAALIGYANGATLSGIETAGNVEGTSVAAGLVANAVSTKVHECYNVASVSARVAGGVIGTFSGNGDAYNLCNAGTVRATSEAGGVIGIVSSCSSANMHDYLNTGLVEGKTSSAGLIGKLSSSSLSLAGLYSFGSVMGTAAYPFVTPSPGVAITSAMYDVQILTNGIVLTDGYERFVAQLGSITAPSGYAAAEGEYFVPTWLADGSFANTELLAVALRLENDELASHVQSEPVYNAYTGMSVAVTAEGGDVATSVLSLQSSTHRNVYVRFSAKGLTREVYVSVVPTLFDCGKGTETDPYCIRTVADLENLSTLVSTNVYSDAYVTPRTDNWSSGKHFILKTDGLKVTSPIKGSFQGSFLGDDKSVELSMTNAVSSNVALFETLGDGAYVAHLEIKGEVKGKENVAALAANAAKGAVIEDVANMATISASGSYVGGICAKSSGNLLSCANLATVSGANYVGGIVGYQSGSVDSCINTGAVNGNANVGGIAGCMTNDDSSASLCSQSTNAGMVSGSSAVGGVAGSAKGYDIEKCINVSRITANKDFGAIVGTFAVGATTDSRIRVCSYDSQVSGATQTGAEALTTKQMLALGDDEATHESAAYMYPYTPLSDPTTNATMLAAVSMVLADGDEITAVRNNVILNAPKGVEWTCKGGCTKVKISSAKSYDVVTSYYELSLEEIGQQTLVAKYGDCSREITIDVDCAPVKDTVRLEGCGFVEVRQADGSIVEITDEGEQELEPIIYPRSGTDCDTSVVYIVDVHKPNVVHKDTTLCGVGQTIGSTTFMASGIFKEVVYVGDIACDTIITHVNVVTPSYDTVVVAPSCDELMYKGIVYKQSTTLYDTIRTKSCGCDSIIHVTPLVVNRSYDIVDSLAPAIVSMIYAGEVIKKDTLIRILETKTNAGCDSIRSVFIKIIDPSVEVADIYTCDLYVDDKGGGKVYRNNVILVDTTYVGEEVNISIRNVFVHHNTASDTLLLDTLFGCGSYKYAERDASGVEFVTTITADTTVVRYIDRLSQHKCDSVVIQPIVVHAPALEVNLDTVHACLSYLVESKGIVLTKPTTLKDTLRTMDDRCDSIIYVTHYDIQQLVESEQKINGCDSVIYTRFDGKSISFKRDTVFVDSLVSSYGCTVRRKTVTAMVSNPIDVKITKVSCEPIEFEGKTYTQTMIFTDTIPSAAGCDSLIRHISLRVQDKITHDTTVYACEIATVAGKTYTAAYTEVEESVGLAANGVCDSFLVYHINVLQPITTNEHVSSCEVVEYDGETFIKDTTFVKHLLRKQCDCDSTVNVSIKVYHSESFVVDTADCGEVVIGDSAYTKDTNVVMQYENEHGCLNTVSYRVKILKPSYRTITIAGESSVVYDGVTYRRSQTITHETINSVGCDSIVTIHIEIDKDLGYPIVINKFNYVLFCNNRIGTERFVSYQWIKNGEEIPGATGQYYEESKGHELNGCYQVSVFNAAGREFLSENVCIEKERELSVYPTPVAPGGTIYLQYDFTVEERRNLYVEVFSPKGTIIQAFEPTSYPIEISGITQPGQYFVMITVSDDRMLNGKFIVK